MKHRRSWKAATFAAAILIALITAMGGCAEAENPDVRSVAATVVQEGGRYLLIADSSGTRFLPARIPFSYREHGLRVYVSGRTSDTISVNGTPEVLLEITSLSQRSEP